MTADTWDKTDRGELIVTIAESIDTLCAPDGSVAVLRIVHGLGPSDQRTQSLQLALTSQHVQDFLAALRTLESEMAESGAPQTPLN